jgi:putative FmdB family regulatory protein
MPIYEYRCGDCDEVTSVFLRSTKAKVSAVCEHCGSKKLSRIVSLARSVRTTGQVVEEMRERSKRTGSLRTDETRYGKLPEPDIPESD